MTRPKSEVMKALEQHFNKRQCGMCPYFAYNDCSNMMFEDVRELLNAQHRSGENDTIVRLVKEALNAGGQHIMVSADGNVSIMPETQTAQLVPEEGRDNHWHCSGCGTVFGVAARTYRFCPECGSEFSWKGDDDETD